jgi:hypothetical protein
MSVVLLTRCTFERIDELACVAALLANSPLENSSPVHPATLTPYYQLVRSRAADCSRFVVSWAGPEARQNPPERDLLTFLGLR